MNGRQTPIASLLLGLVAAVVWLASCAARQGAATAPVPAVDSPAMDSPASDGVNVALGLPIDSDPSDDLIIDHQVFVVSYNAGRQEPNWVAWRLVAADLGTVHRSDNFHADLLLPLDFFHVGPLDYRGSGYDRGHLCPSGDRTSSASANWATFAMTNIQPQVRALNAGPWERLETYERELAGQHGKQLFIVAGGLFDSTGPRKVIGPGIAVPRASFKVLVVLEPGQGPGDVTAATSVYAVIMPNTATVAGTRWQQYMVTVDEVESESGYDFLSRVPDPVQRVVEGHLAAPP